LSPPERGVALLACSGDRGHAIAQALADNRLEVTALCILHKWQTPRSPRDVVRLEIVGIDSAKTAEVRKVLTELCGVATASVLRKTKLPESAELTPKHREGGETPVVARSAGWDGNVFRLGPLTVDSRRRVAALGGVQLGLSYMLFDLLLQLCRGWSPSSGAAFVRADWNDAYHLRHALGSYRHLIVTGRGWGYRLARSVSEADALHGARAKRRGRRATSRGRSR
jgi:hypothetical protein